MLIAGVDVGNATTEVVVIDTSTRPPTCLAWDHAPTRGAKGSAGALRGAAALLQRLQRRIGRTVDLVAAAPGRPVTTRTMSTTPAALSCGRLQVVPVRGDTPGGSGVGAGLPVWAHDAPHLAHQPVVLLVARGTGFNAAVAAVQAWTRHGARLAGVLLGDDEGVLVAARIGLTVPVADQVDVDLAARAVRVAVEVRPPGHPLQALVDPLHLSSLLGLAPDQRSDAVNVAACLGHASSAVVVLQERATPSASGQTATVWVGDPARPHRLEPSLLAALDVGAVSLCGLSDGHEVQLVEVDDLWAVDVGEVASSVAARVDASSARALVIAALRTEQRTTDPSPTLTSLMDLPVHVVSSETDAARAGAMTTPRVSTSALIADIGGGTIDVITTSDDVVAAGAGELLTAAVSHVLHLPLGAADWVKRGPSARVEAPQLTLAEDGTRSFLQRPAPAGVVGRLTVPGPAGFLPFGAGLAPTAWRALRLRLKQRVVCDNLVRALTTLGGHHHELLLVGGAAGDGELLGLVRAALPSTAVGRADVACGLGHRYAVAYGAALMAVP